MGTFLSPQGADVPLFHREENVMRTEQIRTIEQLERVEEALRLHGMQRFDDPFQAEYFVAAAMVKNEPAPKALSRFTRAVKWVASHVAAFL